MLEKTIIKINYNLLALSLNLCIRIITIDISIIEQTSIASIAEFRYHCTIQQLTAMMDMTVKHSYQ